LPQAKILRNPPENPTHRCRERRRERPRRAFSVCLVPIGDGDAIRNFRMLLKIALRRFNLRAVDAREICETGRMQMSTFSERIRGQKKGFYKVADLDGNKEIVHTISHVLEQVMMFNKEVDILCFSDTGRQFQLNQTTSEWLIEALGDDPELWSGKRVCLYLASYKYEGETKMGIRLKLADTQASDEDIPY
jgi:hypothetical protein